MADLDEELRGANPLMTRRASPLPARARQELMDLLASTPERAPKRRRAALPTIGFAAAASIAVVASIVFAATSFGPPEPSVAAPPQLETTPLGDDLGHVVARLAEHARAQTSLDLPTQTIRLETWSAQVDASSPVSSYYVQPEEVEKIWRPDRSGSWRSWAGAVRYGVAAPRDEAPEPGTSLRDETYAAGAFPLSCRDAPPNDAVELAAYLRDVGILPDAPETIDYFAAIEGLRYDRSMTGAQTAAALELIAGLPDVTLAGTVTDRLGREGVAIQTERASGSHRMLLIFSPDTGLLLSSETIYLGGIPDNALEYPTVLNYFAWKD